MGPAPPTLGSSRHVPSEALSDAEEKVEVPGLTDMRVGRRRRGGVVVKDGVDRWIEVIAEVSAHRPNGGVVAQAQPQGVGEVVEVAGLRRVVSGVGHGNIAAGIAMRLLDAYGAGPDLRGLLKGVAHVIEENEAEICAHPTQSRRRGAELQGVDEDAGAADRIPRLRVARPGGVDGKAAMGGGAAGIKPLRQRDQLLIAVAEGTLLPVAGLPRE